MPLDPDVRAALAVQIARDGPHDPLIVWKSRKLVVDGIERLSIYRELGIRTCPVIYRSFSDLDAARRWRFARNVNRRQLNPWCRAVAAIELVYADWRKRDKGRNGEGEKIDEVVALSHVSKRQVERVLRILRQLDQHPDKQTAERLRRMLDEGQRAISSVACSLYNNDVAKKPKPATNQDPVMMSPPRCSILHGRSLSNRIVNDDCLAVNRALADDSVGMIITSIPYLGAHRDYKGTFNDLATYDKYLDWLKERIVDLPRILLSGAIVAINVDDPTSRSDERQDRFRLPITRDVGLMLEEAGLSYFDEFVWVKQNASGRKVAHGAVGSFRVRRNHETILLYSNGPHKLAPEQGHSPDAVRDDPMLKCWLLSNWSIPPAWNRQHGAVYPYRIPMRLIRLFSHPHQLIYDPFCGTGTTCRAAKDLKRRWLGVDVVADYVRMTDRRLAKKGMEELNRAMWQEAKVLCPEPSPYTYRCDVEAA